MAALQQWVRRLLPTVISPWGALNSLWLTSPRAPGSFGDILETEFHMEESEFYHSSKSFLWPMPVCTRPHSTACTAKGNGYPLLPNKIKWNQIKALLKHLVHPEYRRFLPDSKEWWRVKLSRMKMVFLLLKGIFILKVCKAYLFRCLWQYVCMCMSSYIPQRN